MDYVDIILAKGSRRDLIVPVFHPPVDHEGEVQDWIGGHVRRWLPSEIYSRTADPACAHTDDHLTESYLPHRACENRQTIVSRISCNYRPAFCRQRLAWQLAMSVFKEAEPDLEIDIGPEDLIGRWNDEE